MGHGLWDVGDRTDQLKALWNRGLSGSAIGAELHVSRSAVLGKLARLGLLRSRPREVTVRNGHTPRPREPRVPVLQLKVSRPLPEPVDLATEAAPTSRNLTIFETDSGTCKWPYATPEGTRYCGHPGQPFCRYHAAMAYMPVPARDRRLA